MSNRNGKIYDNLSFFKVNILNCIAYTIIGDIKDKDFSFLLLYCY